MTLISLTKYILYTLEPSFFQGNPAQMEGLEELHNNIMFYLTIFLFAISWIMISIVINFKNKKISNKYVKHGTLVKLIWTITPALMLLLIFLPLFKLLYLIDEIIDPALVIRGEGNHWYWDFQYLGHSSDYADYSEETQHCPDNKYPELYHSLMDYGKGRATEFPRHWGIGNSTRGHLVDGKASDMAEYVAALEPYQGRTLRELNITLNKSAWPSRLNQLTWQVQVFDPGAFLYYDPDSTLISPEYLQKALTAEAAYYDEIEKTRSHMRVELERKEMKEFDKNVRKIGIMNPETVPNYPYHERKWFDAYPSTLLSFIDDFDVIPKHIWNRLPKTPDGWFTDDLKHFKKR